MSFADFRFPNVANEAESILRFLNTFGAQLEKVRRSQTIFEHRLAMSGSIPLKEVDAFINHLEGCLDIIHWSEESGLSVPTSYKATILERLHFVQQVRLKQYYAPDNKYLGRYITFCTFYNKLAEAKEFLKMVFLHNVKVWIEASRIIILEDKKLIAAEFLQIAFKHNKGNRDLYKQILLIELEVSAEEIHRDECTRKITILLRTIRDEKHSIEFLMELFQIIFKPTYAIDVQTYFACYIFTSFRNQPEVWDGLAKNELLDNNRWVGGRIVRTRRCKGPITRLKSCIKMYHDGYNSVSKCDKPKMRFLYLDFIMNKSLSDQNKILEKTLPKRFFKSEYKFVSETEYLTLLKTTKGPTEDTILLVKVALRAHPYSSKLWAQRLYYESLVKGPEVVEEIFILGRELLQEGSLLLWKSYIAYHAINSAPSIVVAIYDKGIEEHPKISNSLKPQYLQYLFDKQDMISSRRFYSKIADTPPYCKELHIHMLMLEERSNIPDNADKIESIHMRLTDQFKNDLDVFLGYAALKVRRFIVKYKGQRKDERIMELKVPLDAICKMAEPSLSNSNYEILKRCCGDMSSLQLYP